MSLKFFVGKELYFILGALNNNKKIGKDLLCCLSAVRKFNRLYNEKKVPPNFLLIKCMKEWLSGYKMLKKKFQKSLYQKILSLTIGIKLFRFFCWNKLHFMMAISHSLTQECWNLRKKLTACYHRQIIS